MKDKGREFWLDLDGAWYGYNENISDSIHVIDHASYLELKAQADLLAGALMSFTEYFHAMEKRQLGESRKQIRAFEKVILDRADDFLKGYQEWKGE